MRNVRNAWITVNADGNREVSTGPRSAIGGLSARILVRECGSISDTDITVDVRLINGCNVISVCVKGTEIYRASVER